MRGVILVSLENASFHMVHVYTINWFKKVQNINYCSHAAPLDELDCPVLKLRFPSLRH
jgi:hypothetical protein